MARRKLNYDFIIKIGMVFLLLTFAWSVGAGADANSSLGDGPFVEVKVSRGDTVWSIAAKHLGEKDDIRNLVVAIRKLNGLGNDVSIHPGQILKVPVKNR